MEKFADLSSIIWTTIAFLTVFFLLKKMAWGPILKSLKEREESIEDALNQAAKAKEEMQNLQSSNEALLKEAREERDALMKEARDTRDSIVAEAKEKATAEGVKIISSAREEIEIQKKAAIADIKTQVAELSIEIAEKVIKQNLSEDTKQKELVNSLLAETKLN